MGSKKSLIAVLIGLCLGGSGCALLLVSAGAAGGYAMSKDSVKNHYDLSQDRVFRAALVATKELGQISEEDSAHGIIRAKVGETSVTITVKPITKKTVELKVKARKTLMPDIEIAQQVYNKINSRL